MALDDLEILVRVVDAGSLSAAGRALGFTPAMVSKRITRLEQRLGVRLLQRTTRRLAPTETGRAFYERAVAILAAVDDAEALVTGRAEQARGPLRVSAPTSFGRMHIAPHLKRFLEDNPEIRLELDLTDDFVDLVSAGIDVAIRIGSLPDSSLVAQRLAPNRRMLCATPAYLAAHGVPENLQQLGRHHLLAASHQTPWRLTGPDGTISFPVTSLIRTNSSEVVREATLADIGIALRSNWDVGPEVRHGRLRQVLPEYGGAEDAAIFAVYPNRKLVAPGVRRFVRFLADLYGPQPYWDKG